MIDKVDHLTHSTPVSNQATLDIVKGKDVYGVLPVHMAAAANTFTWANLNVPRHLQNRELSREQSHEFYTEFKTYVVQEIY